MKFPIEYKERQAWEPMREIAPAGLFYDMPAPDVIGVVADGEKITVCSWCVPRSKQVQLEAAGFILTHGICAHCLDRQRNKEKEQNEASK